MTTFFLSRHGRTAWNAQGRYAGITDLELDDAGREQSARLANWARTARLTGVVSSPMTRAVQTAAPAAGGEPGTDDRLREVDFGVAEGRRRDELDPDVVRRFVADPVGSAFPGGEDPRAAAQRFTDCLADLHDADLDDADLHDADLDDGGRILVVAHNTLLRLGLCALLGIPLSDYRRRLPVFAHDTVTELSYGEEGAALLSYNVPLVPCDATGGGV